MRGNVHLYNRKELIDKRRKEGCPECGDPGFGSTAGIFGGCNCEERKQKKERADAESINEGLDKLYGKEEMMEPEFWTKSYKEIREDIEALYRSVIALQIGKMADLTEKYGKPRDYYMKEEIDERIHEIWGALWKEDNLAFKKSLLDNLEGGSVLSDAALEDLRKRFT